MPTVQELLTQFQRDSSDVTAPSDVTTSTAPKKKTVKELLAQYQGPTIGEAKPEVPAGISKEQFMAENLPLAASGIPGVSTLGAVKLIANELNNAIESSSSQAQEFLKPIQEKDQYGLGPFALAGRTAIGLTSGLAGMVTGTADKLLNPELVGDNVASAAGGMVGDMAHSMRGTPFQLAELARQIPESMGIPREVSEKMNLPAIILDKIGEIANAPMGNVDEFKKEQVVAQQDNPAVGVGNAAMIGGTLAGIGSAKTTLPKVGERPAYDIPGLGSETPDNPIWTGDKKAPVNMIDNAPDVSPAPDLITRQAQIEKALETGGGDIPKHFAVGGEAVPLIMESASRTFDRNPAWKELVYRPTQELEYQSKLQIAGEEKQFNEVAKQNDVGMTNRTAVSNAIGANLISKRAGGAERLALTGETVRDLAPNEQAIADHITNSMADHFQKMNKVRAAVGKDPIPPVENYFTFAQAVDELVQSGGNPVLADPKAIAARARTIADEATMGSLKHAGKEAKPVNTDAFGIYRNYIEHAIRYENLTPHIDRVNRMLDGTYGMDQTPRPNVTMKNGRRVPDYTLGKEEKLSSKPRRGLHGGGAPSGAGEFGKLTGEVVTPKKTETISLKTNKKITMDKGEYSPLTNQIVRPAKTETMNPRVNVQLGFRPKVESGGPELPANRLRMGKTPERAATPENAVPLAEKYPNLAAYTRSWLNDVAGVKPVKALNPTVERIVSRLQRNITRAALSGNVMSTLIQPTALVPAYAEIGPKYLSEGVGMNLIPKHRRFARENSNVLFGREHETSISDAAKGIRGRVEGVMSGGGDIGLKFLKIGDYETAQSTWLGAYKKGVDDFGLAHDAAKKYADDVVVKTQGSASPIDRAPIQRSQLGKAASMFGTYTMNNWGYMTRDLLGRGAVKRNTAAQISAVVNYTIANQLVNTVYGQYSPQPNPLRAIEQYRKDNPKDRGNAELLAGMAEFWKVVPLVGSSIRYGDFNPGGPIVSLGTDMVRGGLWKKPVSNLGRLGGIPGSIQAQKIIDYESEKKKKKKKTR